MATKTPAPIRHPMLDSNGLVTSEWQYYLTSLGGGGGVSTGGGTTTTKVVVVGGGAAGAPPVDVPVDDSDLLASIPLAPNAVLSTDADKVISWSPLTWDKLPTGVGLWNAAPTITGPVTVNGPLTVDPLITTRITSPSVPSATDLTISPTSDLILAPGGLDILPPDNGAINIGTPIRKFRTLSVAELTTDNLVAAQVRSTVGGRVIVAPTTRLVEDCLGGDTTIYVKHNNLGENDLVMLEARGMTEFMRVTSSTPVFAQTNKFGYTVERYVDTPVGAIDFTIVASDAVGPNSGTATSTITITAIGGMSTSVALSVSGLPTGVTASFSPTSTLTSSTLTFTIGSSAAIGVKTVTVVGIAGSLTHTVTADLQVLAPVDFGLTVSPTTISVQNWYTNTTTVTVTKSGGFSGAVTLSASGLPTNLTATFATNPTTTTSTVTFAANGVAPATYTITITGTSGALTHTTSIAVTTWSGPFLVRDASADTQATADTRALSPSGVSEPNNWLIGDGVVNTRTPGYGLIDLYAPPTVFGDAAPAPTPVTKVRSSGKVVGNDVSLVTINLPGAAVGNAVVVAVYGYYETTASLVNFISDSASPDTNIYQRAVAGTTQHSLGLLHAEIWFCSELKEASPTYKIYLTLRGAHGYCHAVANEYNAKLSVDVSATESIPGGASYVTNPMAGPTTAASAAAALSMAVVSNLADQTSIGVTTGWTQEIENLTAGSIGSGEVDTHVPVPGSTESCAWTLTAAAYTAVAVAVFKRASGATATTGNPGPTIVGYLRTGAEYNNIQPRWAIGNLNGVYGYISDIFGCAFGDNTKAWVKIDPADGVRIGYGTDTKISLDASGNAKFVGSIAAASGTIGGWNVTATAIKDTSGSVGLSSAQTTADDVRFWAGGTDPTAAPFRVYESGGLTLASGNSVYNPSGAVKFTRPSAYLFGQTGDVFSLNAVCYGNDTYMSLDNTIMGMSATAGGDSGKATVTLNARGWDKGTTTGSQTSPAAIQVHSEIAQSKITMWSNNLVLLNSAGSLYGQISPTVSGSTGVVITASQTALTGNLTQTQSGYIYPGSAGGLSDYQTSYYLASHASFGLYSNTGLGLAGVLVLGYGQVSFPAAQNPSSNVNMLDDYEEGTWTPSITSAGGGAASYNSQAGWYVKVGKLVTAGFYLNLASKGTLAAGNASLSGLPFATENPASQFVAVNIPYWNGLATVFNSLGAFANPGTTSALMIGKGTSALGGISVVTIADLSNILELMGSVIYRAQN